MARGNGKRYDEEFKVETVKYITENHKSVAQVAREVYVNGNALHGWVRNRFNNQKLGLYIAKRDPFPVRVLYTE